MRERDLRDDHIFRDDWISDALADAIRARDKDVTPAIAQKILDAAVNESLPEAAQTLLRAFTREARSTMPAEQRDRRRFERNLQKTWGNALDQCRIFHALCREIGSMVNNRHRPELAPQADHLFEALTRLHGRACVLGLEVLTLLDAGLASGAHARWRALHEVAVVADFLAEQGPETARRYLLHDRATAYRGALAFQKHAARLGEKPFTEVEMAEMRSDRDALREEFGACYDRDNGWALAALKRKCDPAHRSRPACRATIADLEESVQLEHWRPEYAMASHAVHAGSRALHWNLEIGDASDLILAGPADGGLYEPIVAFTQSLLSVTRALVMYRPSYTLVASMLAVSDLMTEISREAYASHQLCERRRAANDRLWRWQDWLFRRRPR